MDEETVRLRSHVAQLRTMLESDEPMGRKMDFLIQEVNRESNTIGSKCCDVAIAQVVVGPQGRGGEDAGTGSERGVSHGS